MIYKYNAQIHLVPDKGGAMLNFRMISGKNSAADGLRCM